MSRCMLLMVAFGALAASLDSYRTTVFGSSSVAGLASIGPSMSQPSEIELDLAAFASATANLIRIIKPSRLAQRCAHLNPTPHAYNNAMKRGINSALVRLQHKAAGDATTCHTSGRLLRGEDGS